MFKRVCVLSVAAPAVLSACLLAVHVFARTNQVLGMRLPFLWSNILRFNLTGRSFRAWGNTFAFSSVASLWGAGV